MLYYEFAASFPSKAQENLSLLKAEIGDLLSREVTSEDLWIKVITFGEEITYEIKESRKLKKELLDLGHSINDFQ